MLRRTAAVYVYEKFRGHISGDKGYMTLQQACTIYGFQMNDSWTKKEVKKRFRKLALRYHPDHGGTDEQFRALGEAKHLLLTHRRDKKQDNTSSASEAQTDIHFRRVNYDEATNTIHRQTYDQPELRSCSVQDVIAFGVIVTFLVGVYVYRLMQTQSRILSSRWNRTTDELRDSYENATRDKRTWHPWGTDNATQDRMDDLSVFQGRVRGDVVNERRSAAPATPRMPWQTGRQHEASPASPGAAA